MKLAILSDIHGNLPALEAVLADVAQARVDQVLNLGDILSGPLWPREMAERLMGLDWPTIAGNHERQVLHDPPQRMKASDAHAAAQLGEHHREWLAALPATLRFGERVLMCHGTPDSDLLYLLDSVEPGFDATAGHRAQGAHQGLRAATADEAAQRIGPLMREVPHALLLCGHSHVPRVLQLDDGRLLVNPGSVGLQAYDDAHPLPHWVENGTPHARYALLTLRSEADPVAPETRGRDGSHQPPIPPAGWQVELRAIPYDHAAAARQAERNGRPDWADALRTGRVGRTETPATRHA